MALIIQPWEFQEPTSEDENPQKVRQCHIKLRSYLVNDDFYAQFHIVEFFLSRSTDIDSFSEEGEHHSRRRKGRRGSVARKEKEIANQHFPEDGLKRREVKKATKRIRQTGNIAQGIIFFF